MFKFYILFAIIIKEAGSYNHCEDVSLICSRAQLCMLVSKPFVNGSVKMVFMVS